MGPKRNCMHARHVLFLDFDDTICLNTTYGAHDVIEALREIHTRRRPEEEFADVFLRVFDYGCAERLAAIDREFSPVYVLSTSWTALFNRAALLYLLRRTRLAFVASGLHEDWETPKPPGRAANRRREIEAWLLAHPETRMRWVALDDEISGAGLTEWSEAQARGRIVLCRAGAGLDENTAIKLRAALKG